MPDQMTSFQLATLAFEAITIIVIIWGIGSMRGATDQRSERAKEETIRLKTADDRRHEEAAKNHTESMRALEMLIAEQQRQRADSAAAAERRHEEDAQRHAESMQALRILAQGQQELGSALREQGATLGMQATNLSALVSHIGGGANTR